MSCRECVFRSEYRDMGASADVCILHRNLASAISACDRSEGCRYRFMISEAKEIVKQRAGGLPEDKPIAKPRESSGDPEKDFQAAMISIREAGKRVVEALRTEIVEITKAIEEATKK